MLADQELDPPAAFVGLNCLDIFSVEELERSFQKNGSVASS